MPNLIPTYPHHLGLGFHLTPLTYPNPMTNAFYPPPPSPAPAPATSDKTGNRQKCKKQGKQDNKTPQKEKTGSSNTTLPRTSLRPSKLHFCYHHGWLTTHEWLYICYHHGWLTTHEWPSGNGVASFRVHPCYAS